MKVWRVHRTIRRSHTMTMTVETKRKAKSNMRVRTQAQSIEMDPKTLNIQRNGQKSNKHIVTVAFAMTTFGITFASSVFGTATAATAQLYGVSTEVMTLENSFFF